MGGIEYVQNLQRQSRKIDAERCAENWDIPITSRPDLCVEVRSEFRTHPWSDSSNTPDRTVLIFASLIAEYRGVHTRDIRARNTAWPD